MFMSLRQLCIHLAFSNKAYARIHPKLTGQLYFQIANNVQNNALRGDASSVPEGTPEPVFPVNIPVPAFLGPDKRHLSRIAIHDSLPGNLSVGRTFR